MPITNSKHKQLRTTEPVARFARDLRKEMTPAEGKLWARLRNHQLDGLHFRRQHALGPYIADFICTAARLIVEIDGDSHAEQVEQDEARTEWLSARGYRVIRFWNHEIMRNIDGVLESIRMTCGSAEPPPPQPSPAERERESDTPARRPSPAERGRESGTPAR
ncbi:MAG: endonuclease domain-containing protein [Anaerolineae bacterium]